MQKGLAVIRDRLLPSKQAWSETLSRVTNARPHQFPRLRLSPNRILALRLRAKNEHQKSRYRGPFRLAATLRSGRLPILTFQTLLAKQDLSSEKELAAIVASKTQAEWTDTLNSLAGRGWSKDQLDHWVWIISGEDGDVRVERLLSTDHPKPIFLLLFLLRNNETYRKPESLSLLIRYASRHHFATTIPSSKARRNPRLILTVTQFRILMRRLIYHAQTTHPRYIISVARLVVDYIKSIPHDPHHKHHRTDYYDQCIVYNSALFYLKRLSSDQPLANMEFNWRAQKVLLAMSDSLPRSLIINKASYQAIREVLVGLRKSAKERGVALRYTKSWPPYKQDFDARDTKRTAEDDMSRSVKAGVLMQEAGYPEDDYDRALNALGGMGEGSPTIQTRSRPPRQWADEAEELNVYSNWAANVRATRNAQEAWRAFNMIAEKSGLAPNFQVYNEMFVKLQAIPVDPDSALDLLPGDSRESFPVHDANYSRYELARLSPPTVSELHAEMTNYGIKPRGHGLHSLVIHAKSIEEGLRYLQESGIPSDTIQSISPLNQPSFSTLQKLSLVAFSSYIQLLCRLQPNRRGRERLSHDELQPIRHAIALVRARLRPNTVEATTFRPPWHSILRALARPHIAIKDGPVSENDLEALTLFMKVFQSARDCIGTDAELFILLCRAIQKASLSRLRSLPETARAEAPLLPHPQDMISLTTSIFSQLTTPIVEDMPTSLPIPQFQFPLGPPHLHTYMRTLAFLEAKDEMVKLVFWMMNNYEFVYEEACRLPTRGEAMIAKTFCAFHAFASPTLDEDIQQALADRMERLIAEGGYWRWPTPQEVEDYVHADARGSETLQRRILARSYQKNPRKEDSVIVDEIYID